MHTTIRRRNVTSLLCLRHPTGQLCQHRVQARHDRIGGHRSSLDDLQHGHDQNSTETHRQK